MDKCNTVRIKKRRIFDMEDIDVPDGKRVKNIEKVPINIQVLFKIHCTKNKDFDYVFFSICEENRRFGHIYRRNL